MAGTSYKGSDIKDVDQFIRELVPVHGFQVLIACKEFIASFSGEDRVNVFRSLLGNKEVGNAGSDKKGIKRFQMVNDFRQGGKQILKGYNHLVMIGLNVLGSGTGMLQVRSIGNTGCSQVLPCTVS